jgi:hypothetical protein
VGEEMKLISVSALLFVILLGALFIYVAADIPDFGDRYSAPNRYIQLFSMDASGELEDDLSQGVIPTRLMDKIEEKELPLPYEAKRGAGVFLFSLHEGIEEVEGNLNKGIFPEELKNEFEGIGVSLSDTVRVMKEEEDNWVIADKEEFIVKKEGDRLNIYEAGWDLMIEKGELYYPDEQKYYFIEKDGDTLNVYRYALIVRYIEEGHHETEVPNMVTYILADYRSYDTLGETTVIFTAGVAVILLLRRRAKRPE